MPYLFVGPIVEVGSNLFGSDVNHHIDHTTCLLKNARKCGLWVSNFVTPKDGSCFFHTVNHQLSRIGVSAPTSTELRKQVVEYIKTLPNSDPVIDTAVIPDIDLYLGQLRLETTWADAVVVNAVARMLCRRIVVVTHQ